MAAPADLIRTYIRAKDDNRPYLMKRVFAETASLEMDNLTGAVSFPPLTEGVEAITETFIRRFAQTFENVYTLCLAPPPPDDTRQFSCGWLLGMSEKDGGALRSGCGRYDWFFGAGEGALVEKLKITIELMPPVGSERLDPVMDWLAGLPYPWCTPATAIAAAPALDELRPIIDHLSRSARRDQAASAAD